jgi:hypothetical protein
MMSQRIFAGSDLNALRYALASMQLIGLAGAIFHLSAGSRLSPTT